ncbi:MAG: response regulator [Fimbriimonadaceae bacterium]|nr:response regulator [Fimbriimonadaceae bacterium]
MKAILLIEDNPDDERLAVRAIQERVAESRIVVARDGAEAVDQLENEGDQFDLVLLDLKLPKISGLDVLRRLRGAPATAQMPVIVLTSSNEGSDLASARALGADLYVQKAVDLDSFRRSIDTILDRWLSGTPVASDSR